MDVCNKFNSLTNPTGTFLMFSQYPEDLTKNNAQGYTYRVVPSKFYACNIDFTSLKSTDLNTDIATFFNNLEQSVYNEKQNVKWYPYMFRDMFWKHLHGKGILKPNSSKQVSDLLYVGDINHQSYDNANGIGYSGIYCYIPDTVSKNIVTWNDANNVSSEPTEENFVCNSIIVLYDIYIVNSDGKAVINVTNGNPNTNIPMGIYFPGVFENNTMTNLIYKYYSNPDGFGAGTSYGVRICTRMTALSTQFDHINHEDSSMSDEHMGLLCQLLSSMSENMVEMKKLNDVEISNVKVLDTDAFKQTLLMLQNNRINVPYPVKLLDGKYWFVNGKNTGIMIPDGKCVDPYSQNDFENDFETLIQELNYVYVFEVFCSNMNGEKSYAAFDKRTNDPMYVSVRLLYGDETILADELHYREAGSSSDWINGLNWNHEKQCMQIETENIYDFKPYFNDGSYSDIGVFTLDVKKSYPIFHDILSDDDLNKYLSEIKFGDNIKYSISPSPYNRVIYELDETKTNLIYMVPAEMFDEYSLPISVIINRKNMDDIFNDFTVIEKTPIKLHMKTGGVKNVLYYAYVVKNIPTKPNTEQEFKYELDFTDKSKYIEEIISI